MTREATLQVVAEVAAVNGVVTFENRRRHKDGSWRWLVWAARSDGEAWFAVAKDVTDHKSLEQRAIHDALTGLPNRTLLLDRLERALSRVRRSGGSVTVLFIDLDCFKSINDTRGHETGDAVLVAAARRLGSTVRAGDTVGRLGGDEFVVIAEDLDVDLIAVLIGFPAGVIWFLLRLEAFFGGRGDRFIAGTPAWVAALPFAAGIYVGVLIVVVAGSSAISLSAVPDAMPNLLLVIVYSAVGFYLLRTQLANRRPLGGWSVSGLTLAVIFPTCALMHGAYAYYVTTGQYGGTFTGSPSTGWPCPPGSTSSGSYRRSIAAPSATGTAPGAPSRPRAPKAADAPAQA